MTAPTLNFVVDREAGPDAPTLTLVHGVGDRLEGWDGVAARLSGRVNLVRYDLRGHGASDKPPGPYDLDDFVEDHRQLLASLGVEHSDLAGFSLGGLIAQAVAVRAPELVDRLVLVSCIANRSPEQWEAVRGRLALVEEHGPAHVASLSKDRWYTDEYVAAHPKAVEEHLDDLASNTPKSYAAAYRVLASNDLIAELPKITARTLVVTGEHDVGSPPEMAEAMHRAIAGSRLVVLARLKHSLLMEAPDVLADLIADFILADR